MSQSKQASAIKTFGALHQSGCFVIPNPWDPGTARYLEHLGFKAVATTSAGAAFTQALSERNMSLDQMLAHIRGIANATSLPVNADFRNGFAHDAETVAKNVGLCVATGVAGLSVEDSTGDSAKPLYDFETAVDRVRAARSAIDSSGIPVLLTARCEAWLVGQADPLRVVLERLVAYADAGAECLFAPGVRDPNDIRAIVKAVSPIPVNVIVFSASPELTVPKLTDLGVRRISVGAALSRVAWGAFIRTARQIAEQGTFDGFADAVPSSELLSVFDPGANT